MPTYNRYGDTVKVLPLMAPVDLGATGTESAYIDLNMCVGLVEFEVNTGLITDSDSTSGATIAVYASTAGSSSDTNTAVTFRYRQSAAVGTDTMGALSTDSTSLRILEAVDNVTTLIYVDPAVVAKEVTDGRYLCVYIDADANVNACLASVVARYTPRYAGASMPSST